MDIQALASKWKRGWSAEKETTRRRNVIFVYYFLLARIETRVVFLSLARIRRFRWISIWLSRSQLPPLLLLKNFFQNFFGWIILCRWVLLMSGNFRYFSTDLLLPESVFCFGFQFCFCCCCCCCRCLLCPQFLNFIWTCVFVGGLACFSWKKALELCN